MDKREKIIRKSYPELDDDTVQMMIDLSTFKQTSIEEIIREIFPSQGSFKALAKLGILYGDRKIYEAIYKTDIVPKWRRWVNRVFEGFGKKRPWITAVQKARIILYLAENEGE